MKNSGFTVAQIDEIILVGGSTRILAIQDALTALKVAHQLQDLSMLELATKVVNDAHQALSAYIQAAYQGGASGQA